MKVLHLTLTIYLTISYIISFAQETNNYFVLNEGDTVFMYENPKSDFSWSENNYDPTTEKHYSLFEQRLYYYNSDGKPKNLNQNKIRTMQVGGRYFDSRYIKKNKGQKRLHEILITGSDFSITQHWAFGKIFYLYIWDKNGISIKQLIASKKIAQDEQTYNQLIKPRIENCPKILKQIESNLDKNYSKRNGYGRNYFNNMFFNITNLKCD